MRKNDETFLASMSVAVKPQGFLDAISEIQQYCIIERSGTDVPKDFLTIKGALAFFWVGFKGALFVNVIMSVLSPFAFAVINRSIPVFGVYDLSLFDQVFVFFLPLSFSLMYSLMLCTLGNYYIGSLTRGAILNLLKGIATGAVLKCFFVFVGFHYLSFFLLQRENVSRILSRFSRVLSDDITNKIYYLIMSLKVGLIPTSWMMIVTTVVFVGTPLLVIMVRGNRLRKVIEEEKNWSGT